MGKSKRKKLLRDLIGSDDFHEAVVSIIKEEIQSTQPQRQHTVEVVRQQTVVKVVKEKPLPLPTSMKVHEDRKSPQSVSTRVHEDRKSPNASPHTSPNTSPRTARRYSPNAPPTPREEVEPVEIGEVMLYAPRPKVEFTEGEYILISTYDGKVYNLLAQRGSAKSNKVKCASRPSAVMKIDGGVILTFTTSEGVDVVKYDDAMSETSRDNYKTVKGISRDASVVSYQNSMYHSDFRDGKLYLLELKKNWVPGNVICKSGDSVYVATQTRIRRYYANKNSNIPVWEHIPVSGRTIRSLQADQFFVTYSCGRVLSVVDLHGESHYHTFKRDIIAYTIRGKCYILTDDSTLHTYDPETKKVIDHFPLDVHDLAPTLYATDDYLYYTTGSSVHRLQLS